MKYLKLLQHVSDHRGSIIREPCTVLGLNYKNGSIVSVDMDMVGVTAAYSDPLCMCVVHCVGRHSSECLPTQLNTHMHNGSKYAAVTPNMSMSTDTIDHFCNLSQALYKAP